MLIRYRFGLEHPNDSLGLPIGRHISIMAVIDGKQVIRSYTPTTIDERGYFELIVKVRRLERADQTYPEGTVSQHLAHLRIGDTISARGPKGTFTYSRNLAPHLLMLAGGSGITPMYQIIKSSIVDPEDKTVLRLIYANIKEEDICENPVVSLT